VGCALMPVARQSCALFQITSLVSSSQKRGIAAQVVNAVRLTFAVRSLWSPALSFAVVLVAPREPDKGGRRRQGLHFAPRGARSSHWYMPQTPSSPRA
jgi:hypothetical protein